MNRVENWVSFFIDQGFNDFICSSEIQKEYLSDFEEEVYHVSVIEDARSAAFYSFGRSKLCNKASVLIVYEEYLSNCYSALTEAYHQNIPVFVLAISLKKNRYESSNDYLDACVIDKFIDYCNPEIFNQIQNLSYIKFPMLFCVYVDKQNSRNQPMFVDFNKLFGEHSYIIDKIHTCEVCYPENEYDFELNRIELKYRYGVLSKYVGSLLNRKLKSILVVSNSVFALDQNILSNRYTNDMFKLIVVTDNISLISNYSAWIESNNINCFQNRDDILAFLESEHQSIMFIESER